VLVPRVLEHRLKRGSRAVQPKRAGAVLVLELKVRDDAEALGIPFEQPMRVLAHHRPQGALAVVAEGRMPKIVRETSCLDKVGEVVESRDYALPRRAARAHRDGAPNLSTLVGVRETGAKEVVRMHANDLALAL
jgi:hypothetical protein